MNHIDANSENYPPDYHKKFMRAVTFLIALCYFKYLIQFILEMYLLPSVKGPSLMGLCDLFDDANGSGPLRFFTSEEVLVLIKNKLILHHVSIQLVWWLRLKWCLPWNNTDSFPIFHNAHFCFQLCDSKQACRYVLVGDIFWENSLGKSSNLYVLQSSHVKTRAILSSMRYLAAFW